MRSTHETNIAMAPGTARMYALDQFSAALAERQPRLRPALRRLSLAIVRTVSQSAGRDVRPGGALPHRRRIDA